MIRTDYWVAKVDSHGTAWNTDGPHSSREAAEKSIPLLRALNKKDIFVVTECRYRDVDADRNAFSRRASDMVRVSVPGTDAVDSEILCRCFKALFDCLKTGRLKIDNEGREDD